MKTRWTTMTLDGPGSVRARDAVLRFRADVLGDDELVGFEPTASFRTAFDRYRQAPGFVLVVAASPDNDQNVLGYGFGLRAPDAPENLWYDDVYAAAPGLAGGFVVVELLVARGMRGHGLGAALLESLVVAAPRAEVWLACPLAAEGAYAFYRARGGDEVVRGTFSHGPPSAIVVIRGQAARRA